MSPSTKFLMAAIAILLTCGVAHAQGDPPAPPGDEPGTPVDSNTAETAAPRPDASAAVVVRDPDTGELRAPTAEERRRLAPSIDLLQRSDAGLVERRYRDGTVGVRLEGRFQSVSVIRRDEAASRVACTHDASALLDLLSEDVPLGEGPVDSESSAHTATNGEQRDDL